MIYSMGPMLISALKKKKEHHVIISSTESANHIIFGSINYIKEISFNNCSKIFAMTRNLHSIK